jgi:hypothetical protein
MTPNVTYQYVVALEFLVAHVPSVEPNVVAAIIHLLSIISDFFGMWFERSRNGTPFV